MADVDLTPRSFAIAGGDIPLAFLAITPAVYVMAGGDVAAGANLSTSLSVGSLRLDRLTRLQAIVEGNVINRYFQGYIQKLCESIERAFAALRDQVNDNTAILAALQQTQQVAQQAVAAAAQAQSEVSIVTSAPVPLDVLTADSSGTITIAAHERDYSGTRVAVNGGTVTGLTGGLFYRVYYNDAGREGGAVTYIATQDVVTQSGAVHVVGGIAIPAAGEPPVEGTPISPPGYVYDNREVF